MSKVTPMKKVHTSPLPTIETITPEVAEKWLTLNTHNRTLRDGVVERYAEAMKRDQWDLNGETIKFSETNVLLDGQHRLWAVIESGVTIESYVIRNLPDEVFETIDTGTARHARDTLHLNGFKHPTILGMAGRLQFIHENYGSVEHYNKGKGKLITNRDILELVQRHPDLERSVDFIVHSQTIKAYLTPAMASFLHYQFSRFDSAQSDVFMSKLAIGDGLAIDHPILIARNRLATIKSGTGHGRIEGAGITIKAWNLYRNGKTAKVLRWPNSPGEAFPVIK